MRNLDALLSTAAVFLISAARSGKTTLLELLQGNDPKGKDVIRSCLLFGAATPKMRMTEESSIWPRTIANLLDHIPPLFGEEHFSTDGIWIGYLKRLDNFYPFERTDGMLGLL